MSMPNDVKHKIVVKAISAVMLSSQENRKRILFFAGSGYSFIIDAIKNKDVLTLQHISIALRLSNYAAKPHLLDKATVLTHHHRVHCSADYAS